jgi:hypothetical protein
VRRLLDLEDEIVLHVRHLKITDFEDVKEEQGGGGGWGQSVMHVGDPDPADAEESPIKERGKGQEERREGANLLLEPGNLEKIIGNSKGLQSFSWNAVEWIPESVITALETHHPDARLCVTNNRRWKASDRDLNLDARLLSSPLLYSLNTSVFYLSVGTNDLVLSEFPNLKKFILKANKLRVLTLKVWMGISVDQKTGKYKVDIGKKNQDLAPLNLPLRPGDMMPPITDLTISDWMPYDLRSDHCAIWRNAMDWTRLQRLDLRGGCPRPFFEELCGAMPQLKSLRMGFKTGPREYGRFTCEDPSVVRKFAESIDGLQELYVTNYDDKPDEMFAAIEKHYPTLQTLEFHTPPDQRYRRPQAPGWSATDITCRLEKCPQLEDLRIDIALVDVKHWPTDISAPLARFTKLRKLKLFIEVPIEASDFSEEYEYDMMGGVAPPPLKDELAREVAVDLWRRFFGNDKYAHLRELELCFTRLHIWDRMDSGVVDWRVRVTRAERDDKGYPGDGEGWFEFISDGKYRDSTFS